MLGKLTGVNKIQTLHSPFEEMIPLTCTIMLYSLTSCSVQTGTNLNTHAAEQVLFRTEPEFLLVQAT